MEQPQKNTRFVKIHPNFSCMFNATEISFLVLLLDQEYLKDIGLDSNWSRAYFQKSMKTGNEAFVKCTSRLESMGLISITENGSKNKKCYSMNIGAYTMILNILDTTNNRVALHKFCETNFIEKKRRIEDISTGELDELKNTRKFQKKATMSETDILNTKPCLKQICSADDLITTMSETDILSGEPCLKQAYYSEIPEDGSVYPRIIQDLDIEIQRLLSLKKKYMSESGIFPEEACLKQTHSFNDKKALTMSESDTLNIEPCLKPTYSIESGNEIVTTMSETDILTSKNSKSMSVSDISIDNIYNNINSKNNIIEDKEDILDNYKNASGRSIFHKGEKRSEEEKLVPSPSSSNQKFIDSLIQDMKEEFPDGDRAKRTEVLSFFSELKEDYLSHDPELSQLSLEEIFPHFKSAGVRIYTYYSEHIEKSDEELRLEFMSLPVSEDFDESLLGLSDQEKVEMIKSDFREAFPEDEMVELDAMTDYVVGYMRDLELMKVDQVLYDSPLLLSHMFPELQRDKESKLWHRRPNKAEIREIDENGGRMIVIKPKFKERAEKARIDSNPFYEKLKRFRFPRLTITSSGSCNASEVIPKVLAELGYENGFYEDQEVIDQILDVIIDRYKLQGRSFEPFRNIWVYCDKYHHKQPGKVLITNLPEIKKMKA